MNGLVFPKAFRHLFFGSLGCALLALVGCETYQTQTTSGQDYLSAYPTAQNGASGSEIDDAVRAVAAVEPTLRFPARIGLAKLYNGQIVNLDPAEVEAWGEARDALGSGFGEFVPVSALIAEMVYATPAELSSQTRPTELVKKVRLGAARQHLDAVLIYEVFSETEKTSLVTSVADWTIIGGYFIPSKNVQTTGYANALLLDVRNGYPYGTAATQLTDKELETTFGSHGRSRNLAERNQIATSLKLIPQVEQMMRELVGKLGTTEVAGNSGS